MLGGVSKTQINDLAGFALDYSLARARLTAPDLPRDKPNTQLRHGGGSQNTEYAATVVETDVFAANEHEGLPYLPGGLRWCHADHSP